MKRFTTMLVAVALLFTGGFAYGQQETGPHFEHLKSFRHMVGNWQYEGPLLEAIPGYAEKGSRCVTQITWRWILNKNAVEVIWSTDFAGGKKISGKGLFGWNAADKKVVFSGMNSIGSMELGTLETDEGEKGGTLTVEGVDAEGNQTSSKEVAKIAGRDTLTLQVVERTGGDKEGPGPVYTYKRVQRGRGKKADK